MSDIECKITTQEIKGEIKDNQIEAKITMNGSQTLEGLRDVDITNPTNGQSLIYNSTNQTWENNTGAGAGDMTKAVYDSDNDNKINYNDLANQPTIPANTSDLNNDSGFITASDIPAIPDSTSDLTNDSSFTTLADVKADVDIDDAIDKKHSHSNQSALDLVSGTNTGDQDLSGKVDKVTGKDLSENDLTDALKTAYDGAVTNSHSHANKADLDAYDPDNFEPADATILKDADIGSTVQAYDANTVKTSGAQTLTDKTLTDPKITYSINTQTDSYTLALTDASKLVLMNKGTANTLTVPKNSVVAFPVGTQINIMQLGAGKTTVAPVDGDVTINSKSSLLSLAAQYAGASLIKTDTNTWLLVGDLIA